MDGELTLTVQAARPAAALGNGRTAALLDAGGTVSWLAFPAVDGIPIFDAGQDAGATFALAPSGGTATRAFVGETPVLRTSWELPGGRADVVDFLPIRTGPGGDALAPRWPYPRLVRIIEGLEGEVTFRFRVAPRPGGQRPELIEDPNGLLFTAGGMSLVLQAAVQVVMRADGSADGEVTVKKGEQQAFMLTWHGEADPNVVEAVATEPDWELDGTFDFWLAWSRICPFQGVQRSEIGRLLALVKAWAPLPGIPAAAGAPPFFGGPWLGLAPVALAAWGHEHELGAAIAALATPATAEARIQAGWLLDALATGNASGLLDPFAFLDRWPQLAAAADVLAAAEPGGAGQDLAVVAGLRGAGAIADDLVLAHDAQAWRTAAEAAFTRLAARPPADLPAAWDVALGLREAAPAPRLDGPAAADGPPPDPTTTYWAVRAELVGGAWLQARRALDAFLQDHEPSAPGPGPDPSGLAGVMWLAAQVYLQGPPTPERVPLPGDLGD